MDLTRFSDKQIATLYRIAKTRAYAFFRDPREMIRLRNEKEQRGV